MSACSDIPALARSVASVGVPELVRGDAKRSAARTAHASVGDRPGEAQTETACRRALPVFDEEEADEPSITGMRKGVLWSAQRDPLVEDAQSGVIEGDRALGGELAERHP